MSDGRRNLDDRAVATAAEKLAEARRSLQTLPGLPDELTPISMADGYAIQRAFMLGDVRAVRAWKIGCTAANAQAMFNIAEPFCGPVFAGTIYNSPAELTAADFHMHGVECEFVLRLGAALGPESGALTREELADYVDAVIPAIEIVSTRYDDFTGYGAAAIVADCAANGGLVLGEPRTAWQDLDLAAREVALKIDGAEVKRGRGRDVLGHPLAALAWFVARKQTEGETLPAGLMIATGTCTGIDFLAPGQQAEADFGELGTVRLRFD
jgi:2-oxo-3-hexenedioate decarboxylase/2-keto-4-pentenoate hydratase